MPLSRKQKIAIGVTAAAGTALVAAAVAGRIAGAVSKPVTRFTFTTYPYAYVKQFIPSLLTQMDYMQIENYCAGPPGGTLSEGFSSWVSLAENLVGKVASSRIDMGLGDFSCVNQCYPGPYTCYSSAQFAGDALKYILDNKIRRVSVWPPGGGAGLIPSTDSLYSDPIFHTTNYYEFFDYFLSHGGVETVAYMNGNFTSNIQSYGASKVVKAVACQVYTINNSTGTLVQGVSSFDPLNHTKLAHSLGMKMVAMFTGGSGNFGTDAGIAVLLKDTSFTGPAKALGDALVSLAKQYGFDEWQADLETIAFSNNTQGMANLLNYLAKRVHAMA